MRHIIFAVILVFSILLIGCCATTTPSETPALHLNNQTPQQSTGVNQSGLQAVNDDTNTRASTNNLDASTPVSGSVDEFSLLREEMYPIWQEKDSWDNYKYDIQNNIIHANFTSDSNGDLCWLFDGNYSTALECSTFSAGSSRSSYRINIEMQKSSSIEAAQQDYESVVEELSGHSAYSKKSNAVAVGNEMVTAEGGVGGYWWEYVVLFRRNNVVVDARIRQTLSMHPSEFPQYRKEIDDYAILIDEKIQ